MGGEIVKRPGFRREGSQGGSGGWIGGLKGGVSGATLSAIMFENLREDWVTYERDWMRPGIWVMVVYRFGQWRYGIKTRAIRLPFSFLYKVAYVLMRGFTGIELPCEVTMGRRCRIDHSGGIVVSGWTVMGDDCVIRHGVTIGVKMDGDKKVPVIGNRVDIGAGAVVLGDISIGDDVIIGANAVVLHDIPAGMVAVGVPARILKRKMGVSGEQR